MLSLKTFYEWFKSWDLKAVADHSTRFACFNNVVLETAISYCSIPGWTLKFESVFLLGILYGERPKWNCWTQFQCQLLLFTIFWPVHGNKKKELLLTCFGIICTCDKHPSIYLCGGRKLCRTSEHQNRAAKHSSSKGNMKYTQGWQMLRHVTSVCASSSEHYQKSESHCVTNTAHQSNRT